MAYRLKRNPTAYKYSSAALATVLPPVDEVKDGTLYYSGREGTYAGGGAADYPIVGNVRYGTVYSNGTLTGTLRVPGGIHVRAGTLVDASVGVLDLPAESDVRSGTYYDSNQKLGTLKPYTSAQGTNSLTRDGIAKVITDMLQNDTVVLYGTSLLVQTITYNSVEFINAAVTVKKPFKIFLWTEDRTIEDIRSQNADEVYKVSYKIEGLKIDPDAAVRTIDLIDQRMAVIFNQYFYDGSNLSTFYTDSKAQIFDGNFDNSSLSITLQGETIIAECTGAFTINVNRWK